MINERLKADTIQFNDVTSVCLISDSNNQQSMKLIDHENFFSQPIITKMNESISDEIDQSTIMDETFCESYQSVNCDLNETFCQSYDTVLNEAYCQSNESIMDENFRALNQSSADLTMSESFGVASQSNEVGIIFGNNSSLIFSFDDETPSIRGCAAVGLLSGSTKKSSFLSLSVNEFCSKFQCLSTSSKLSFTSKSSSVLAELRNMKKNAFRGAAERRFTKLVCYALMDPSLFSLAKYDICILRDGYSILEQEAAAIKIQRFIRTARRNASLKLQIVQMHQFCSLPYIKPTDLESLKACLAKDPQFKLIRNRWKSNCTLTQSALIGCNIAVLSLLNPTFRELIEVDSNGRSSIHYLSFNPNMKVAMCLAGILNAVTAFLPVAIDCSDSLLRSAFSPDSGGHLSYCSKVVKVGWLMKRANSPLVFSRWQKRWIVLSEDSICYYHTSETSNCKPSCTLALSHCTVKRGANLNDHTLEIRSDQRSSKKNIFGYRNSRTITLKATSEGELQSWLKYLVGLTSSATSFSHGSSTATRFVNHELRNRWVSAKDANEDTALHIMVRFNKSRNMEAVKQIAWLVDNGCPINAQNNDGHTALHLAVLGGVNKDIIRSLLLKGADVSKLPDNLGQTVLDIATSQLEMVSPSINNSHSFDDVSTTDGNGSTSAHMTAVVSNMTCPETRSKQILVDMLTQHQMKVMRYELYYLFVDGQHNHRMFTGFTYLSLYLGKMSFWMDNNEHRNAVCSPYIRISVVNRRNELVEDVQEIWNPTMVRPAMIYWGWSFHMTTPLENLVLPYDNDDAADSDDSSALLYIIFESREKDRCGQEDPSDADSDSNSNLICKVKFPIDFRTLNSGPKTLRAEQTGTKRCQGNNDSKDGNFLFPNALSCESSDEGAHLSIDIVLSHGTAGC